METLDVVLAAVLVSVFAFLPMRPLTALYLACVVTLEPFTCTSLGSFRLSYETLATYLFCLRAIAALLTSHEYAHTVRSMGWFVRPYAVFVVFLIPASVMSMDVLVSLKAFLRYASYLAIVPAIAHTARTEGGRKLLVRSLLFGAAITCSVAAYQLVDLTFVAGDRTWKPEVFTIALFGQSVSLPRLNGTTNNANAFAMYLVFLIALLQALARRHGSIVYRLVSWAVMPFLLCTFSRAAWLALIILLVGCSVSGRSLWPRVRVICGGLAFIVTLLVSGIGQSRVQDLQSDRNSFTWRLLVWNGLINQTGTVSEIMLGKGLDTVVLDNTAQERYRAHNTYLAFYHDAGVCGVVGLLWLFCRWIAVGLGHMRRSHPGDPVRPLVVTCAIAMAVLSVTEEPIMIPVVATMYYTVLAISLAAGRSSTAVSLVRSPTLATAWSAA